MRPTRRCYGLAALLLANVPLAAAPGQARGGSPTETMDFEAMHRGYVDQYADVLESQTLSGDCYVDYSTSYSLHGMISAVEATRDETLLQKTMHYVDNMLSVARDLNGDGHLEWGTQQFGPGQELSDGRPWQLPHFQGAGPIPRLAAVIMTDPAFKAKYEKDARRYIDFIRDSIIQYWHVEVYDHQIPWLPEDLGGWGTYEIWNDKCSLLGHLVASLYRATGDTFYRDLATRIAQGFQRKLEPHGQGWIWDNGTIDIGYDGNQEGVPDTSHANREPMMMVLMHEAGIVFTRQDLERLAHTLTDTIWNGSLTAPRFANYINGSNKPYRRSEEPSSVGNVYPGWALLGRYSAEAQEVLVHTCQAIQEDQTIGQNAGSYCHLALSGHLLRNSRPSSVHSNSRVDLHLEKKLFIKELWRGNATHRFDRDHSGPVTASFQWSLHHFRSRGAGRMGSGSKPRNRLVWHSLVGQRFD